MAEPGRAGPPLAGRLAPTGLSTKAPPTATVRALVRTDAHTGVNPRVYVTEATVGKESERRPHERLNP